MPKGEKIQGFLSSTVLNPWNFLKRGYPAITVQWPG